MAEPATSAIFHDWHADPHVHAFLGYQNNELVAYGELWIAQTEQEIELARIVVCPSHRGIGIGQSLMQALVDRANDFELTNIVVRVIPENLKTIRCYHCAGFETVPPDDQQVFNQEQPRNYIWLKYAGESDNLRT